MQTWLGLFYKYLNTPDCRRKRDKNRLQHATHVRTILEDIDLKGKDLEMLSEDEGYIVWTEWVDRKLERKRSGTVRSHLGSYNHFLKFVTKQRVRTDDVKEVISAWCQTTDLDMRPQKKNEKILKTCDNKLTNDDQSNLRNPRLRRGSSVRRTTEQLILVPNHKRSVDGPTMLPVKEYVQNLLDVWVKFIRPAFSEKGFKNLFLQIDGTAFDGWTIGK
ncbi:unnamed protein product [Porites lobata]|uniref:Core-binding (CB) domain-containing protein n=1 Tax=Porites lobata TaxID=104759 RepID=A0ABN8QDD6_9CNID|nr:unnamed protein product [Porites lobata]